MSAGKFVGEALTTAVLKLNPFGPEGIQRRARNKAFRKAWRKKRRGEPLTPEEESILAAETVKVILPDGTELQRVEPTIPVRTSTKSLLGGTFLAQIYVQLVGLIPHEGLVAALTTPEMIALISVALAAGVARFTKSPAVPGKL